MQTFTSFNDLKLHLQAKALEQQQADVKKAENLRKSRSISKKAAGTGPRVAR